MPTNTTGAVRWTLALLIAGGTAAPAAAQVPGIDFEVVPKVGFYVPVADLATAASAAGEIIDDRGGSFAIGLALDFGVALAPVSFRAGFDYVTGSEFTYADTTGAGFEATGDQTMLAIAGDVVLRPLPRLVVLQPYLLAGAGVKRYDFDFGDVDTGSDVESVFPESRTDFTLHAGVGLDFGLGPIALLAEVSDYVSWYDAEGGDATEMQHDLFIMAGIRIGLF